MAEKKPKKKSKGKKTKVICISHKEDADGISSAALIKEAFGGETVLEDYPGMMDALKKINQDEKLKTLFICDLGLSKKKSRWICRNFIWDEKEKSFNYIHWSSWYG